MADVQRWNLLLPPRASIEFHLSTPVVRRIGQILCFERSSLRLRHSCATSSKTPLKAWLACNNQALGMVLPLVCH